MEFSSKAVIDGTEYTTSRVANRRTISSSTFFLRFLAMATTLIAIIVMAVSKQTKIVSVVLVPTLPPLNVQATAKWQYLSAFTFFMASNIIACIYATASLIYSMVSGQRSKNLPVVLIILDLTMMALLFASSGAAGAIGVMGYNGNSHVQWNKVCNAFGSFCHHVAGSALVSLLGALAFFLLIVLTTMRIHRTSA